MGGIVSTCYSVNNLAFHKTYTVFPLPNYKLTASATDKTSLTDGKYTVGFFWKQNFFWKQKTTVGWSNWQRSVEIMIDLGRVANIAGITFNTARNSGAKVNYPSHISAFVGTTKNQFQYVGNIANDPDNVIGPYQIKKFALDGISARGRYVLLLVQPNGPFLFCDEIEVLEGGAVTAKSEELTLEAARSFSLELLRLDIEKKLLSGLVNEIKANFNPGTDSAQLLAVIEQRFDTLSTLKDAESIAADLLKLRAALLSAKFPGKSFAVEIVNPWRPLSPVALPLVAEKDIVLELPQGGYDHAAFVVTNLSKDSQEIVIQPDKLPPDAPDLALFQVPFIKSATFEYIADPLVSIKDRFNLRSGESKMVFLAAHGLHPGSWENTIKVGTSAYSKSLPLSLHVSKVILPQQLSLNTVNWGYLDFKPIRDHKSEAVNDLLSHHINVIVIPPQYIPTADQPSLKESMQLDDYLKLHIGATKVLFFLNFNDESLLTANGKYPFMSDGWKEWFKKLYTRATTSAVQAGFSKDQVYMYPFDEIKENDLTLFVELATWARKEIAGIKLYATLDRKNSLSALPYLDIAQVINREDMYAGAKNSKKEIWLYGTLENTKSLPPYIYYRLMSWRAFAFGFTGAGFWNYADTGSGEYASSAWDDFDGKRPDFSVIYEGENGAIISSRRWEAWRVGVEDYELLSMYAKTKGHNAARNLAEVVVNNPENISMADEVRHKIMRELSL